MLAVASSVDASFIEGDTEGWIVHVGIVPVTGGRLVATTLIAEVLRHILAAGETRAQRHRRTILCPVYQQLGLSVRARCEPSLPQQPLWYE